MAAANIVVASANGENVLVKVDSPTNSGTIDPSNPSYASQTSSNDDRDSVVPPLPELEFLKYTNIQISLAEFELRERYFKRCFPNYRKQFQHNVNSWFTPRAKVYTSTSISPDTRKFTVMTDKKWAVYQIPEYYKDPPTLLCSSHSQDEDVQVNEKVKRKKSLSPNVAAATNPSLLSQEPDQTIPTAWSHQMVSTSNRYLAVAGSKGILRVYDMENHGRCVYHHQSKFNIRFMAISPNGTLIACAITGIDNTTKIEQPMIVLHWLQLGDKSPPFTAYTSSLNSVTQVPGVTVQMVETVSITIPYQDVINCLSFSPDEAFLSCGTNVTSHILIINVTNPHEPRMMLKTSRYTDKTPEAEGITSIEFFPRSRFMLVTSVAHHSYPMIIDTKIKTTSSQAQQVIPRLSMFTRISKVGASIHKSCISPRGNSAAFLDKNGLVYIMYAPNMQTAGTFSSSASTSSSQNTRVFVVTEVCAAQTYREAASIRFSPTGHALFIVDQRGNFYVEDFAVSSTNQPGIGKCRHLA